MSDGHGAVGDARKQIQRRVDQTIYSTDPKRQGNCLAACVATFLEIELEQVPHFIECGIAWGDSEESGPAWWAMFLGFMAGRGLWPVQLERPEQAESGELTFVMGMSPRGVCHQVLYRDGELWHDPHPSRDGVLDVRELLAFRALLHDHTPTPEEPVQ